MLAQLSIQNFALVASLTLEFEPGFNVLTGETGAGKSILIDAITAALGERVNSEFVREGARRATLEAVFEVGDCPLPSVQEWAEDGLVILAREITAAGRSTCRINGRISTASVARAVAADLIDIHGQHDHQSLLSPERHVEFLDNWTRAHGGRPAPARGRKGKDASCETQGAEEPAGGWKRLAETLYSELRSAHRELRSLAQSERDRAQKVDLYRFQLDEIDVASPAADEEEDLLADRVRLANAEKLYAAAAAAKGALADREASALDLLVQAARDVELIASLDEAAAPMRDLLETALTSAQEAATELRVYADSVEFNPERLQQVQDRLEQYRVLKRKYGDTVAEILSYRERIAAELDTLTHSEERRAAVETRVQQLSGELDAAAQGLYGARQGAAGRFEQEIAGHLADLNMAGTRFRVHLDPPASAGEAWERGLAAVLGRAEFLISANPGEPERPLAKIASGGEMSRIMLALKTVMAGSHPVALIFDEIDVGVGGRTAEALGAKMAELSHSNQVLCVTHLPQIASMADRHFQVRKQVSDARTSVDACLLEGEERVQELARMLGGAETTAAQHARELLAPRHAASRR